MAVRKKKRMTPVEKLRHERNVAQTEAKNAHEAMQRMAARNVNEREYLSRMIADAAQREVQARTSLNLLRQALTDTGQYQASAFVAAIVAGLRAHPPLAADMDCDRTETPAPVPAEAVKAA